MKKLVLLLAVSCFLSIGVKAQQDHGLMPDSTEYDLLYVFDTTYFSNCFLSNSPLCHEVSGWTTYWTLPPYSDMYATHNYFLPYYNLWCDSTTPEWIDGYVVGATNRNDSVYAEAFAQEYILNQYDVPYNNYVICGVSIRIGGTGRHQWGNISILDDNLDTISSTLFHTDNLEPTMEEMVYWHPDDWNNYYFPNRDYPNLTNLTNFHIAFDTEEEKYSNPSYFRVMHTCNVYSPCLRDSIYANGGPYEVGLSYDTIMPGLLSWHRMFHWFGGDSPWGIRDSVTGEWLPGFSGIPDGNIIHNMTIDYYNDLKPEDYVPLCAFTEPKHIRRNGEWVDFADDPVYTIWQNIYIAMVPIIMIPSNTQSLPEVELEKMCYLFPNPANNYFNVMSHYTIKSIEVFDVVGKLIFERNVNNFDTSFDVSNFSSGSYVVKINTAKGSVKKKLIVK